MERTEIEKKLTNRRVGVLIAKVIKYLEEKNTEEDLLRKDIIEGLRLGRPSFEREFGEEITFGELNCAAGGIGEYIPIVSHISRAINKYGFLIE